MARLILTVKATNVVITAMTVSHKAILALMPASVNYREPTTMELKLTRSEKANVVPSQ